MAYSVPDLPYDYNALEPHIDEATMRVHHDKHHQAYVDKANAALEGTEWADKPIEEVLKNLGSLPGQAGPGAQQRRRPLQPLAVLGVDVARRRRRARRRPGGGDRVGLRLLRRLQVQGQGRRRQPVRLRLVVAGPRRLRPGRRLHRQPGQPDLRTARRRCWASTSGSTPTTSSTRTSAPTTSTPGGTWSTGRRSPSGSARPALWAVRHGEWEMPLPSCAAKISRAACALL